MATYRNPVYRGDSPDPQAIKVGETWYLFHTNAAGRNAPVLTSPNLVDWTPAGDALPVLPGWANAGQTWAPEVISLARDRFVLYYTVAARRGGLINEYAQAAYPSRLYEPDTFVPAVGGQRSRPSTR